MLVAVGLIASVASLVVRLRRSRDDVRRQLLWIASAAALLAVGVVVILAVPRVTGVEGTWLAALPLRVAQVAVPLCVAVAVLRHRLLEIDLIVNRAVVLAAGHRPGRCRLRARRGDVGLAVDGGTSGFWPSLLATAVVALAFQPLRSRVVRVADRLAFGAAAAPYEALADFSRRLGEQPRPVDAAPGRGRGRGPRGQRDAGRRPCSTSTPGPTRRRRWPPGRRTTRRLRGLEMPVLHLGERLGSITVDDAGRASVASPRAAAAR